MQDGVDSLLCSDTVIYVDGACRNNGQADAKGGCGVYWGEFHPMNCFEPLTGEKQTNNRAEMSAAIIALCQASAIRLTKLTIVSDSRYLKEGISNWINKWKHNGWKTEKKAEILNKDLWVLLDALQNNMEVTWLWVEGHGSSEGNIEADKLAGQGVAGTSCYWQCNAVQFVSVSSNEEVHVSAKSEEKVTCSFCNKDFPGKTIQCSDCKSMCHYSCTRLPRYQLYALHSTHRKFSCETCLNIPNSFAGDIEDEVTLREAVQHEQADLEHASSLSFNAQLSDTLSRNNHSVEKLLENFQSTTIHALESSFVKAIEKLSDVHHSSYDDDQQARIKQLLLEKEKLLKEKEHLLKTVKPHETSSHPNDAQELKEARRELQTVIKERNELQNSLHKTTTDLEISKSKLQSEITVLRQKLDAMSSRNEILSNEVVRLEKTLLIKNEHILAIETSDTELKSKIDDLQTELLSWKLHASRADDSLVAGGSRQSSIIISDEENIPESRETYSSVTKSGVTKDQQRKAPVPNQQTVSSLNSSHGGEPAQRNYHRASSNSSNSGKPAERSEESQYREATEKNKERIILIGTSNVRYLSSRYIAGSKYYMHKEIKYTVADAKKYIESLSESDTVSKFLLHLSCNDIKSVTPESHATSYCNLVTFIHEKYPDAEVIVSLGLPRKDTLLNNKIEVSNAMIKERLLDVQKTSLCDNSNLAFRGIPSRGVLEADGLHLSRRGVFVLNSNFRSTLYNTSSEADSTHYQRSNTRVNRFQRAGNGRRSTSYRRFGGGRFQR